MSQFASALPGGRSFFIVSQRGDDRVTFEVNAGKMVSIILDASGKPFPAARALNDGPTEDRASLIPGYGMC